MIQQSVAEKPYGQFRNGDIENEPHTTDPFGVLTYRQRQIVFAVLDGGQTNQEVAKQLGISIDTVKHHLTEAYRKLGVWSRTELATRMQQLQSEYVNVKKVESTFTDLNAMQDAIMTRGNEIFAARNRIQDWGLDDPILKEWEVTGHDRVQVQQEPIWLPAIELIQKNGRLILKAAVAGFEPDDFDVRVAPEWVLIQSKRAHWTPTSADTVYCSEFHPGRLFRNVRLPTRIDPDRTGARYRNGLLRITACIYGISA